MDRAYRNIHDWEMQIEDISSKLMRVTNGKQAAEYEAIIRDLNDQIQNEHQFIEDL
jgi:archaellum component FlaC